MLAAHPLPDDGLQYFVDSIDNKLTPNGREVFIMGHGVWNSFDPEVTFQWLQQVEDAMKVQMPAFFEPAGVSIEAFPRLFLTSSAQGKLKPEWTLPVQNNIRVIKHEEVVGAYVKERGYEHLGLYNLTVQATSWDGTHGSMETELTKAMMTLNWLNMLEPG